MTKRFDIDDSDIVVDDLKTGESYIFDDYRSCENCCILLNELHEENKELQWKYNAQRRLFGQLNSDYNNYRLSAEDCQKQLKEENGELKFERDRYKRLSEIRQESINNRILTIKEFIDNCSDKEVKKTLEQLFHSEVNEYDLSKKIRKLEKENEQLKKDLEKLSEWYMLKDKSIDRRRFK